MLNDFTICIMYYYQSIVVVSFTSSIIDCPWLDWLLNLLCKWIYSSIYCILYLYISRNINDYFSSSHLVITKFDIQNCNTNTGCEYMVVAVIIRVIVSAAAHIISYLAVVDSFSYFKFGHVTCVHTLPVALFVPAA